MNVAVVSEVRLYRESVAELLRSSSQLRVVGTPSVEDAVRLRELPAEVVIVCGDMRGAVKLAALLSDARLVAVSGADADELVYGVEAGIAGFLSPESSVDDLVDTIERVVGGEFVCPLELAGVVATRLAARTNGHTDQSAQLTPRELEVLRLMAAGLANKEIARRLRLRLPTVKNHAHSILGKLGASNRTEAAARANGGGHRLA